MAASRGMLPKETRHLAIAFRDVATQDRCLIAVKSSVTSRDGKPLSAEFSLPEHECKSLLVESNLPTRHAGLPYTIASPTARRAVRTAPRAGIT